MTLGVGFLFHVRNWWTSEGRAQAQEAVAGSSLLHRATPPVRIHVTLPCRAGAAPHTRSASTFPIRPPAPSHQATGWPDSGPATPPRSTPNNNPWVPSHESETTGSPAPPPTRGSFPRCTC